MSPEARKLWAVVLVCALALTLAHSLGARPAAGATVTFEDEWDDVPNPGRGFYVQQEEMPGPVADVRADGVTVVRAIFRLDQYREWDALPESYLAAVATTLDDARGKGLKVIPSFTYNFSGDGADASLPRVLNHIEQLGVVLRRNDDVLQYINAGFIGAWGEWHSSSNGLDSPAAKKAVLAAELKHFPPDVKIAVRYPRDKRAIFGNTPVSRQQAHGVAAEARIGHSNDCFAANGTDGGTWQDWEGDLGRQERSYVAKDTAFVPMGGETCILDEIEPQYSNCTNAKAALEQRHWSVLNSGFYAGVLDMWKRDGCYEEIKRRLGYRFALVDAEIPDEVTPGMPLDLKFRVRNDGYAAPYNERPVEVVLRHSDTGRMTVIPTDADPRFWLAGRTHETRVDSVVPADTPPGPHEVLLRLPDPSGRLRDRPEYAVRLASRGVWQADTGLNALHLRTDVKQSIPEAAKDSVIRIVEGWVERIGGRGRW